jgi:hypothetical protein
MGTSAMIEYLVQALTWSLFGLAVGWFICHAEVQLIHEIKEAKMSGDDAKPSKSENSRGGPGGVGGVGGVGGTAAEGGTGGVGGVGGVGGPGGAGGGEGHIERIHVRSRRFLGLFLILMALAVSVVAWQDYRRNACQAKFNSDFVHVLTIRNVYAQEDREQNLKMWDALLAPNATPDSRRKAAQEFTAAMHQNEEARAANPLPKLEDRNC